MVSPVFPTRLRTVISSPDRAHWERHRIMCKMSQSKEVHEDSILDSQAVKPKKVANEHPVSLTICSIPESVRRI